MAWRFKGRRNNKTSLKKRTINKSSKFSSDQKKAYFIGLGAGMVEKHSRGMSDAFTNIIDSRQGIGQRKDLCDSARKGYFTGKEKYGGAPPFSVGYKNYPVSDSTWLRGNKKK